MSKQERYNTVKVHLDNKGIDYRIDNYTFIIFDDDDDYNIMIKIDEPVKIFIFTKDSEITVKVKDNKTLIAIIDKYLTLHKVH